MIFITPARKAGSNPLVSFLAEFVAIKKHGNYLTSFTIESVNAETYCVHFSFSIA